MAVLEKKEIEDRKELNKAIDKGAVKITAKNKNDLLSKSKLKRYDGIVENQNLAYLLNNKLLEFDSQTKKQVTQKPLNKLDSKPGKGLDKRRAKANEYKSAPKSPVDTSRFTGKAYSTELGIALPRSNPSRGTTPREKLGMGGRAYRGRPAQSSAEKES